MKRLGFMFALLAVCSGICAAANVKVDLHDGLNFVSCPLQMSNPDPLKVFKGIDINGKLTRWDADSQCMITYEAKNPSRFGNCMVGDGYVLNNYKNASCFSYDGFPVGMSAAGGTTELQISLPGQKSGGGMQLIGCPSNHEISVKSQIVFIDGNTQKTWEEAVKAGWVDKIMTTFNATTKSMETISYDQSSKDSCLRPGKAYWLRTRRSNLGMIITP